jgi:hypothetical protein
MYAVIFGVWKSVVYVLCHMGGIVPWGVKICNG